MIIIWLFIFTFALLVIYLCLYVCTFLGVWGLDLSICGYTLNILSGKLWVQGMGSITLFYLTLNTGAPQGCVLSPLLYSLFTHDCIAIHSSNMLNKFIDDVTDV